MDMFKIVANDTTANDTIAQMMEDANEEEGERRPRGGSRPGKGPNVERESRKLDSILYRQYFSADPIYDHATFRRRFRVSKNVFDKLFNAIVARDPYFTQGRDCTGKKGHSPFQKITAAMRLLAYGVSNDCMDDKLGMAKSTIQESMVRFCKTVIDCFEREYLRSPNDADVHRVLQRSKHRGFPGMLGSMDCSKWKWKACPTAWQGQYRGKEKASTVTLEAIADESLWIWHAFFGMPGCLNDINVIEASPLSEKIASGTYPPPCEYIINGIRRNKPYWLTDAIYPNWPIFIATILNPATNKQKLFAKVQEAARKDIERAFGVLQSMWHIITVPSRFETVDAMKTVIKCVIILHNMVVEDRLFEASEEEEEFTEGVVVRSNRPPMWEGLVEVSGGGGTEAAPGSLAARCAVEEFKEQQEEHDLTKRLLMEHVWSHHGEC